MVNERGGIAQLVERLLCKQDVSGSSPLTSTKKKDKLQHHHRQSSENAGQIVQKQNLENCITSKKKAIF